MYTLFYRERRRTWKTGYTQQKNTESLYFMKNYKKTLDSPSKESYDCIKSVIQQHRTERSEQMEWKLDDSRPIWIQLQEQLTRKILSGWYHEGEKLPSVRELASEAGVNPNTMQRALTELERSGLIYSQRTSGRFVTEDEELIKQMKESIGQEKILTFFREMEQLGYEAEEIIELIHKIISHD